MEQGVFVIPFKVNFQKAIELHHRTGDAEIVAAIRFGYDIDGGLVEDRRHHLRRDKALPNEPV